MAFSKVDEKYVSFSDGGTANGSTGHDVVGVNGTTASAGDVDTLIVGSDTTVNTPTGFTLVQSFVGNQGGYHYERVCTGGESATIRVHTNGDFNTTALFQRWRGCGARDVAVNSHIDANGALSSNAINSGTLAASTELVIVASVMTDSVSAAPTLNTWSTGYTPGDGAASIGTGASCSAGFISHKNPAGTAAETPSVSWTPDNMRNRYTFLVSYQLGSGTPVTINDQSGGAGAGGSTDTLAIGVTLNDQSGGAGAGGSSDTLSVGVTLQDVSGGAGGGGSTDRLSVGVTLADQSGGAGAGGSSDTLTVGIVISDVSGGAGAGGSTDLVSTGSGNVTILDVSGGAGAGGSRDVVTGADTGVVQDTMVMPILTNAMACLQTEANKVPSPPAKYTIRPGAEFIALADNVETECCAGIGWVRPGNLSETIDFPTPMQESSGNNPADEYAVQVELGIMRCSPMISNITGEQDAIPTEAQWLAAVQAQQDDAAALRRVVCCLRDIYSSSAVVAGSITPLNNEGGCGGISVVLTIRAPACDCIA
jgi:hypothetical protein